MAYEQKVMTMKDWIEATDDLLKFRKNRYHISKQYLKQMMNMRNIESFRIRNIFHQWMQCIKNI